MPPALIVVLLMLTLGHVCARTKVFSPDAPNSLNRFAIYVCLPALVLRLVPKLVIEPKLLVLAFVPWTAALLSWFLLPPIARALQFSRPALGVLLLCVPLGNTSFLGFPMTEALLGADALRYAVIYDQLGSFILLSSYGSLILAKYGGQGEPTFAGILRTVVRFPPFWALALAFLPVRLPSHLAATVDAVLKTLGDALVPVAMFSVGLKIELRLPRARRAFAFGMLTKMVLWPACAWALCRALQVSGPVLRVAVLESAMPPMITAGALAMMAGLEPELAAALVGYGVVASMGTLPLVASLVR